MKKNAVILSTSVFLLFNLVSMAQRMTGINPANRIPDDYRSQVCREATTTERFFNCEGLKANKDAGKTVEKATGGYNPDKMDGVKTDFVRNIVCHDYIKDNSSNDHGNKDNSGRDKNDHDNKDNSSHDTGGSSGNTDRSLDRDHYGRS